MRLISLCLFLIHVDTFMFGSRSIYNKMKNKIKFYSTLNIQPLKTIAYYRLDIDKKNLITKSINDRFLIQPIYINDNITDYLGLTLFKYNTSETNILSYKCQLFVYVKDTLTDKCGQYILESVDYKHGLYIDLECVLCSFYINNTNYFSYISYYQNKYDIQFYNNYNYFDFIYDNGIYYKNINNNNILNNIIRYPQSKYISQLKYKDMIWSIADQIIYYKNSFNYVIE